MTAVSVPSPALVVFGRDHAGKPHASWFDGASAELATKAAGLMTMQAAPVDTDALRELVGTLPRGRVFSSGRAFTPFVNGKLYARLIEMLGITPAQTVADPGVDEGREEQAEPEPAEAAQAGSEAESEGATGTAHPAAEPLPAGGGQRPSAQPSRREEIGIGSLVLATTGPAEGWYEAHVLGINGGMFTLKFRDYVEPTVVRRPHEIGFLPTPQG